MNNWAKAGIAAGVTAGAAGAAGLAVWGNRSLTTKSYTVECPGLPAAFDGLRLVQLSDLHSACFGKDQKNLLAVVEALDADLAVITGDLIDRRRTVTEDGMYAALILLHELAKRLPTVRVDGNHEALAAVGKRFGELAARTGAHDITGRGLPVRKGDDRLVLIGIPDIATVRFDEEKWRKTMHSLCAPYKDSFRIALAHRPHYFEDYEAEGLPLVLSGHAHGGQVRLPFVGGLYAPEQGVLPKYTAGKHGEHGTQMIVSRGLGNSGFPVRVGNRPEVVVITLKQV